MKRYVIFAAIGPLLGGFWLLLTTTVMSGFWNGPLDAGQVGKLLTVFVTTLQYSYLFGLLPSLMIGTSYFSETTACIASVISLSGRMMLRAMATPAMTMRVRKTIAISVTRR